MIGSGIIPLGEMKEEQQSYGNQLASTIALLLGEKFEHRAGNPIQLPVDGKDKFVTGNILR